MWISKHFRTVPLAPPPHTSSRPLLSPTRVGLKMANVYRDETYDKLRQQQPSRRREEKAQVPLQPQRFSARPLRDARASGFAQRAPPERDSSSEGSYTSSDISDAPELVDIRVDPGLSMRAPGGGSVTPVTLTSGEMVMPK